LQRRRTNAQFWVGRSCGIGRQRELMIKRKEGRDTSGVWIFGRW
jgi:hypothetical protein